MGGRVDGEVVRRAGGLRTMLIHFKCVKAVEMGGEGMQTLVRSAEVVD